MTFKFDDEVSYRSPRPHRGLASPQASPPLHDARANRSLAGRGVSPTVTRTSGRREPILPRLSRGGCNRHGSFFINQHTDKHT